MLSKLFFRLVKHKNVLKSNKRYVFIMGMITYKYPPFESKKYRYNCVKVSKKRGSAIDVSLSCKIFKKTFLQNTSARLLLSFVAAMNVCAGAVITLMEREIF